MITHYEYEFMYRYYERQGQLLEQGQLIVLRGKPLHLRKKPSNAAEQLQKEGKISQKGTNDDEGEEEEEILEEEGDKELKALENQFLQMMSLVESFQSLMPSSSLLSNTNLEETVEGKEEETARDLPQGKILHLLNDSAEVSIGKEIARNIQQFLSLKELTSLSSSGANNSRPTTSNYPSTAVAAPPTSGRKSIKASPEKPSSNNQITNVLPTTANLSTPIAQESVEILKRHNIHVDVSTGRILNDPNRILPGMHPGDNSGNTPSTPADHALSRSRRNTNLRNSRNNAMRRSKSGGGGSGTTSAMGSFNNAVTTSAGLLLLNPLTQYPTDQYIPMIKDRLSYYSEVIYNLDSFGRDLLYSI